MNELLEKISNMVQNGNMNDTVILIQQALDNAITPLTIINEALTPAMDAIGERFKKNTIFIPEVLIAARAMSAGTELLRPLLSSRESQAKGTVVIGTIKDDLHDIGKNLVRMMMESKGLNVIDLGVNVAPEKYIEAAQEHHADIIACSALLTTTMVHIKDVVVCLKNSELRSKVKLMIGGAPINQDFCDAIGADYYSHDAPSAALMAVNICNDMHAI